MKYSNQKAQLFSFFCVMTILGLIQLLYIKSGGESDLFNSMWV